MYAGFKIFTLMAKLELNFLDVHQIDLNLLKKLLIRIYKSKIFLGMFRLICETLMIVYLRGNYFRIARTFLLLSFQYYADIVVNPEKEKRFFNGIGIKLSQIRIGGLTAAKIKCELIYLVELFDCSEIHYKNGNVTPDICAKEAIFDGLLTEMKIKATTYTIPIFINTPTQADIIYKLINRKLELMRSSYEKMEPDDPIVEVKLIYLTFR